MKLKFFVFSYNRGQYLANCVHSIERCAPGSEVVVFDDHSSDSETLAVLERLSARHTIFRTGRDAGHKLGGLYSNMQAALDYAGANDYACFIQDDTQLVRPLEAEDLRLIHDCFEQRQDLGFISPAFIRGISRQGRRRIDFDYDPQSRLFFPQQSRRSAGIHYSDIFLTRIERLRSVGWHFQDGEPANAARAASSFGHMGYLRCPFLMWLPNGTAYRGKTKTIALRWAERHRNCGFYPFQELERAAVERLRNEVPPRLPVAEEWLRLTRGDPKKPWIYDPLQGSRTLKHLNRVEIYLRRRLLP